MYFWKKGIYHNPKFKDHFVVCDVALHNGCFWKILSKKYLRHTEFQVEKNKKSKKEKAIHIAMSTLKVVIYPLHRLKPNT